MDIAFFTPSYPGLVKIYEVSLQRQGGAMSMIFFINFIHHKSSGQENCLVRSSSKDDMNETIANLLLSKFPFEQNLVYPFVFIIFANIAGNNLLFFST